MNTRRSLLALLVVVLGTLQAFDSGIASSSNASAALVAVAILAPALALLSGRRTLHGAALGAMAVLLVTARVISPVPLPELFLIGAFTFLVSLAAARLDCAECSAQA